MRHPNWPVWHGMKQRCTNAKRSDFHRYGGRGITYDPAWETLEGFNASMGARPSPAHTLDRVDTNGNYCKENCRWATRMEQAQTTRQTRLVTFNGRTQSISAWGREQGIPRSTVAKRESLGQPILQALRLVANA